MHDTLVKDLTTGKMKVKNYLDDIKREIEIMKRLNSVNVVRLHEVIDAANDDKLILVIDFCAKGELLRWNEKTGRFSPCFEQQDQFEEAQIRKFMRDLIEGLDHLHKIGICHRDIKP